MRWSGPLVKTGRAEHQKKNTKNVKTFFLDTLGVEGEPQNNYKIVKIKFRCTLIKLSFAYFNLILW